MSSIYFEDGRLVAALDVKRKDVGVHQRQPASGQRTHGIGQEFHL